MSRILAIESAAAICSVAWFGDGDSRDIREEQKANSHAEKLAIFCEELIAQHGVPDAIAVNAGPGSYTGLRIGVSLAKGLAYGYRIPVLALGGLEAMATWYAAQHASAGWIIPCVDARRMEVYQEVFDSKGNKQGEASPLVVDAESWKDLPGKKVLIGDGVAKLKDLFKGRADIEIYPLQPSASQLQTLASAKWEKKEFADLAYFEPFYLKEFIALSPKPKVG